MTAVKPRPTRAIRVGNRREKLSESIRLMQEKIRAGTMNPQIRALAVRIVSRVPERDERGEINALAAFLKRNIAFRRDPLNVEYIQDLSDSLATGAADCDCYTVAFGSLAQSIGYPVRLRVVGRDRFSHVFPEAYLRKERTWLPVDLTKTDGNFNNLPPSFPRDMKVYVRQGDTPTRIRARRLTSYPLPANVSTAPELTPRELSDLDSWLSELGKKAFGKKAGKALEKSVNKFAADTLQTIKTVAPFIPGVGTIIAKGADVALMASHIGEDPRKMSWQTINEINASNPELAAQLAQVKGSNKSGYKITSKGLTYAGTYEYQDPNAPQVPQVYGPGAAGAAAATPGQVQPVSYQQPAAGGMAGILPLALVAGIIYAATR